MMFDFLIEARARGLYSAITDNGAGGLSSSVGEMAQQPGGARLDLENAPQKYAGLAPWEIFLSEAQERMTLSVPQDNIDSILELADRRDVEATVLGEFTESGSLHVTYGDETVAYLDMEFLHDGAPDLDLVARWSPRQILGARATPHRLRPVLARSAFPPESDQQRGQGASLRSRGQGTDRDQAMDRCREATYRPKPRSSSPDMDRYAESFSLKA